MRVICLVLFAVSLQAVEIPEELFKETPQEQAGFAKARVKHPPTPEQGQGPFFPVRLPQETDPDLTHINGQVAQGIQVYVQGRVADLDGRAIAGATIEVWQACQNGSYNHPRDPNPAPRDPNFQYYAKLTTDSDGNYSFKTIVPGPYPAQSNWIRPSHIHFKVSHGNHKPLITQLYFNGDSFGDQVIAHLNDKPVNGKMLNHLNQIDLMLRDIPEIERHWLIVSFKDSKGIFDLFLKKNS